MQELKDISLPCLHREMLKRNIPGRKNEIPARNSHLHKKMKSTENGNYMGKYNNGSSVDI